MGETTNNRLEGFNAKVKIVCSLYASLDTFFKEFLSVLRVSATPTTSTTVESRYGVRRPQRGAAGRRGQLPWVSRGSSGIVCRRKDVKTGPATRRRRSGYGKLSTGKFWPQQCQLNCHGSRFRVLQDLESDDYRSGASAGHPSLAQRRPRKTALRQVSATDESCCRPTSTTSIEMRYCVRRAQRGVAGRCGPLPWVSRGSCGIVLQDPGECCREWKNCKSRYREDCKLQQEVVAFALGQEASTYLRFFSHIQCQLDNSANPLERDSHSLLLCSDKENH